MARRADHTREELNDLILKAAWKIIGKGGTEALTARGIAAEIGYAPGTIYNLFESMEALSLQINGRTLDELYMVLSDPELTDSSKSITQNLKRMATAYNHFARDHHPYWLMLFNNKWNAGRPFAPWYHEKIDRLFEPVEKILQPLFAPKQDRQKKLAARALWASIHGLCILRETGKIPLVAGKEADEELSSYLIDNFIAGLERK